MTRSARFSPRLPPAESAQALTDLANLRGGHDNITVLVVRITGPALTTQLAQQQPLTIQRHHRVKKSQPVLWIVASVCLLAALALAVLEQRTPALIALAAGLLSILVAIVLRWAVAPRGIPLGETRRLGRGPHVRIECPVNAEFVGRLATLSDQLKAATEGPNWKVDRDKFNAVPNSGRTGRTRRELRRGLEAPRARHQLHDGRASRTASARRRHTHLILLPTTTLDPLHAQSRRQAVLGVAEHGPQSVPQIGSADVVSPPGEFSQHTQRVGRALRIHLPARFLATL